MKTTLYLIRHAATEANLAQPPRLQGQQHNPPLARVGVRQAELTRDFLGPRPIDVCYCSPLLRAVQTASIIAAPHGISPQPVEELTECDFGAWEGLDWSTIRYLDAANFQRFEQDPHHFTYPGGESLAQVQDRVTVMLDSLFFRHAGHNVLVVAHYGVQRGYLAALLGLSAEQMRHVQIDNCGISMITREGNRTSVSTLNASFHLQGIAA